MAVKVNELTQKVIEAKASVQSKKDAVQAKKGKLDSLLAGQTAAKSAYNALLDRQADGTLKPEEKSQVAAAKTTYAAFDDKIEAQREIVAEAEKEVATAERLALAAEKDLAAEQARLSEEDKKLAAQPSGRIEVSPQNATKDPKRGFSGHSDYLRAVMNASMTGQVDERLRPLATQGSDEQSGASNPYGGYFVPVGIAPGVLSVAPDVDPLDSLVRKVPMTAATVKFNARVDSDHSNSVSGGFRVYRRAQTADANLSRAEFEQVTLTANIETGAAAATEEIINDSPESFIAIIKGGMSDEYTAAKMNERINGSGVGERQGILHTPCLITVDAEAEQDADTIVVENIDNMAARCWRYTQAVWLANPTTRPMLRGLVRNIGTGGTGVPYFTQENGKEYLDGRPIYFSEFCPALGAVGDLILGVWSEHLDGTYQSENYAESMHARFLANERLFRFNRRNDGQWWWRSALTPKNGDTLSPAVVLAAR